MEHLETIILVIGLFASSITMLSFVPLTFRLVKTRQTTSFSILFGFIFIISGVFWLIYGGLLFTQFPSDKLETAIGASVPIILTNGIGIIAQIINLTVKYQMINGAKKNNMTEKEYCDLFFEKNNTKHLNKPNK